MGGIDIFKKCRFLLFIFLFLLVVPPGIVIAESEQEEHGEVHHRHRLELFLGNSHEEHMDGFSAGLAYEYRLNQMFGIGGLVEYVGGDFEEWIGAVPIFVHPYKGLRFLLAPGLVFEEHGTEFLFRTGLAYEFEIDRLSITPEFNLDFVDGEEILVYGMSIGYGF